MANNKYAGYTPKMTKPTGKEGSTWSGEEEGNTYENIGNQLDRVNPYEFRKGMDYELTQLGCSRLAESTVEEREKSTEKVLKNLEEHPAYYSALIQFERGMNQATPITEKNFKTYLKSYTSERGDGYIGVEEKITDDKYQEIKEAIRSKVVKMLREQEEEDEDKTAKKATKGAKKAEKGMARFEKEEMAIDELLFGKSKGEEEFDKENPGKGSLLFLKDKHLDVYKKDKDVDKYKKAIALPDAIVKKLQKHADTYSKLGNKVTINDVKGKDLPDTIKKLEARRTAIDKEKQDAVADIGKQRNEIAATDMTRENHLKILEIIRANGISLREGADGVRTYYNIAKEAYLEGLSKGLRL